MNYYHNINFSTTQKVDIIPFLIEKVDIIPFLIEKVDIIPFLIEKIDIIPFLIEKVDIIPFLIEKVDIIPFLMIFINLHSNYCKTYSLRTPVGNLTCKNRKVCYKHVKFNKIEHLYKQIKHYKNYKVIRKQKEG